MVAGMLNARLIVTTGIQITLIGLANSLAFWLRFDGAIPEPYVALWLQMLPWWVAIQGVMFVPFRLYQDLWRYTGIWDLRNIIAAGFCGTLVFYLLIRWGFGLMAYPRSVYIMGAILVVFLLGGVRLTRRLGQTLSILKRKKRVLIYGVGKAAEVIVREMRSTFCEYEPIGFVDDNPTWVGQQIHGVRVLGTPQDLFRIMSTKHPHEVLVALPQAEPARLRRVVEALEPFTVPITTLPTIHSLPHDTLSVGQIRRLAVEDLLPRAPAQLNSESVRRLVTGKRLLVTGAAGSIGAELCRQIVARHPHCLVLYDHNENGLHAIGNELANYCDAQHVHCVLGDITDEQQMCSTMATYRPEIIFHAAAHKHVPMLELNPCEAVKNNILGTRTVAEAAEQYEAERFVLISTDKAVNPISVMGVTKRVAEMLILGLDDSSQTRFTVVRFGNVLGSNGSVVPHFLEQIKAGGPVTVTHPEMRRYFMLIPEAVYLVLQAAALGSRGGMCVLEMGEQVKVLELARQLIRLSGFVPEEEIPITFVGPRPGEKLYEELVGSDEKVEPSPVENIQLVRPRWLPELAVIKRQIAALEPLVSRHDAKAVIEQLRKVVPTFQPEPAGGHRPLAMPSAVSGVPPAVRNGHHNQWPAAAPSVAGPQAYPTLTSAPTLVSRPEDALLLCCARMAEDSERVEQIRALVQHTIDWKYLLYMAHQHAMTPLLFWYLNTTCPEAIPSAVLQRLQDYFHATIRYNLFLTGELLRLIQLFEAHGLCAVPFKGPVLAYSVYGNLALRQFVDLDILVHQQDIPQAKALLISQGYRPTYALTRGQEAAFLTLHHAHDFTRSDEQVFVDLHWAVIPSHVPSTPYLTRLWERLEPIYLGDTTLLTFAPEDWLLVLCTHGARNRWGNLQWICDVARVIQAHKAVDWETLMQQAALLGCQRMLCLGLFLAGDLLGASLPEEIWHKIQAAPAVKSLAAQVYARLFRETPDPPGVLDRLLFYLKAMESPRHQGKYLLYKLALKSLLLTTTAARRTSSLDHQPA